MVVVIVFMGNDLLELEDVSRPHIDDHLEERGISNNIPPQTTEERTHLFNRTAPKPYRPMFWQGINQEIYFLQNPHRYEVVLRKAGRAIELLSKLCEENGAKLIIALLPPFEDNYDYRLRFQLDPSITDLLERKANRALRADLMRLIAARQITAVDFFDELHASHVEDLYDADFHIWTAGHAILAEALLPVVRSALCNSR